MSFDVWTAESPEWLAHWEAWPAREAHAHPAYARLYEDDASRAHCAAWRSSEGNVLYPFLLREIPETDARDTITPYGYGGAFVWGGSRDALAARFWPAYDAWASAERVVSEFVRFSLFEDELLPYPGEREQKLVNVVRTLAPDEVALWSDVEHKVRKNVKKARRSGVSVVFDETAERLDDFLGLYAHTLERRDAASRYAFPRAFFERIRDELRGSFVFAHALQEDRVVSSELALVSEHSVYSFLGGTHSDAFDLRPNDLLKYELILWSKRRDKRDFVLGGGFESDDGIFRYKRSFAPNGLVPFLVGRRVLDPARYAELAGGAESESFPAYRFAR
jgi:hypothetical protein